jgi:hypothetical protein
VTSFAILTDDGDHLGFLLIADGNSTDLIPGDYDCIFTGFPHHAHLFDDPRAVFFQNHKHEEWSANIRYAARELVVTVRLDAQATFVARENDSRKIWRARRGSQRFGGTVKRLG